MLRLDLVVVPNGSGKSTFVRLTLTPALRSGGVRQRRRDRPATLARGPRRPRLRRRAGRCRHPGRADPRLATFIAETAFSHPSKLDLIDAAHAAGYWVFLHVLLVPEELTVARAEHRVSAGGHSVPQAKIRQRYRRLWPLVATAMTRADAATVYDNSRIEGPHIVAHLAGGSPIGAVQWPAWTPQPLPTAWPSA